LARSTTGFCLKKGPATVVNKMPTFGLICDECDIFVASPGSGVPRGRFYDSRPSYWPAHWRFSLPSGLGSIPLKAQILAASPRPGRRNHGAWAGPPSFVWRNAIYRFRPHSRGWTGGRVDALLGVEGAAVGASVWLRCSGGLSLTCELGPAPEALCACWVALDRLEPRERAVIGLAI
jgi:hypothetical protein